MKRSALLSVPLLAGLAASAQAVPSVGVNFGDAGGAVTGTAGVVAQSNWNNGVGNVGSATNLVDSAGLGTGMNAAWVSNNLFNVFGAAPTTQDAALMRGYLDSTNTSVTRVTLTNVAYSKYDVIVYFDGDVAAGRSGNYSVNGTTKGPLVDNANFSAAGTAANYVQADAPASSGNYAVFTGQTAPFVSLTAQASNFRAPVNAIQVVAAPDSHPVGYEGISLNFATGNAANPGPTNVVNPTGVVTLDNWNNGASNASGDGSLNDLVDSTGAVRATDANWTSNNNWVNTSWANDGGIGSLFRSYLDTGNSSTTGINLSITDIPLEYLDGYAVIVYFDGDGTNRYGTYSVSDGATTKSAIGNDIANNLGLFSFDYDSNSGAFRAGNFLYFDGFTGSNLNIASFATEGFRAPISGIQIIHTKDLSIPEPLSASLGLMGLATLALGRRR
jgi:hypothetical protein